MKFKEIEISAFRIYDNPKDATFNFSTESGEIANFISLYAPNGFGKTSFFDAIEWGITNNIHRIWQNENLTKQSIDALRSLSDKQIKLCRNKQSSNPTYVKILTDKELFTRDLKIHGRNKIDIQNSENVENKPFRQVILSQEWISAFLKEVNGELRYHKFMENPDLKDINDYFKNVKAVISLCDARISYLVTEINKKKEQIKNIGENNLLEVTNNQITLLIDKFNETELVHISTNSTKEDIKRLKDFITGRVIDSRMENVLVNSLNAVKTAIVGDENIVSINHYYELLRQLNLIKNELENNNNYLKKIYNLDKLENELTFKKKKVVKLTNEKQVIDDLIEKFDEFLKVTNDVEQKNDTIKVYKKTLSELNKQYENNKKLNISYKIQDETITKKIDEITNRIKELPELKEKNETIELKLKSVQDSLILEQESLKTLKIEIKNNEDNINELSKIIEDIKIGEYSLHIEDNNNDHVINLISLLKNKCKNKQQELIKQNELEKRIIQQQELNSTIQELIKTGLEIVNGRKTSKCPLCEQSYDSYTLLVDRISNNQALSSNLQETIQENNRILQNISTIADEIADGNNQLLIYYHSKIDNIRSIINEKENKCKLINKSINDKLYSIEQLKLDYSQITVYMNGLAINEYEKQIRISLNDAVKQHDDIINKSTVLNVNGIEEQIKINNNLLFDIETEINSLIINEKYVLVKDWFNENSPGDNCDLELLKEKSKNSLKNIKELNDKIRYSELDINNIKEEIISFNKDSLLENVNELHVKETDLNSKIEVFKYFIKENFGIEVDQITKEDLSKMIDSKEAKLKAELIKIKDLHTEYQRLEKYSENINEFLLSEKAKHDLKAMQNNLDFLNNNVKPRIENEKNKTQIYLEQKVKEFFYEDLINSLYKKIDPHPDFKHVEFRVDLEADNPSLNVFVRNYNNEDALIPNLYFSTAQINILSLSIFLASALNSKEYDCIFIDDPIQSLDSINVLSTIDLLRSIVVNQNKQIIISTHDENFHNLLKRKIPQNLFKSKFMELETFGKVKYGT